MMLGVTDVSRSVPCGLYMISLMTTSARAAGRIAASAISSELTKMRMQRRIAFRPDYKWGRRAVFIINQSSVRVINYVARIAREVRNENIRINVVVDPFHGAITHREKCAAGMKTVDFVAIGIV